MARLKLRQLHWRRVALLVGALTAATSLATFTVAQAPSRPTQRTQQVASPYGPYTSPTTHQYQGAPPHGASPGHSTHGARHQPRRAPSVRPSYHKYHRTRMSPHPKSTIKPTSHGQPVIQDPVTTPAHPQNRGGHPKVQNAVPFPMPAELIGVDLTKQSQEEAMAKSQSCLTCHTNARDPHYKKTVKLGCTDCHGGNTKVVAPPGGCPPPGKSGRPRGCPAAPPTRNPEIWKRSSANPIRSYTLLNKENPQFVRFVNPGDLRINHISCGTTNCHPKIVMQNRKSMMAHGCMLWGSALYNNGAVPNKIPRYGELYSMHGRPLRIQTVPPPTPFETKRGVIPYLDPLPRFEVTQPGNVLRIFERGGKFRREPALPIPLEEPGRPILSRLSNRGLGTENRTDPVFIGLQKTRLLDPTLNFLGTNDHPGDYRSSGCTACHIIYANDRSPIHSGPYAKYGNMGLASHLPEDDPDPTIPKDEPGHPIQHRFAKGNAIPTSQCMVCHVHPGTTVMNSYLGYMWWDEETDAELMYPKKQKYPTAEEYIASMMSNPDEAAVRGKWSNPAFLAHLSELNSQTKHSYFADFHGHGWVFRAIFKRDRKGRLLDYNGNVVPDTPENRKRGINMPLILREQYRNNKASSMTRAQRDAWEAHTRAGVPMHLMDLHAEKGMHCVDCHFIQDMHGNNRLQMEVRAGIEIACVDCHGSYTKRTTLRTSGPAAYTSNPLVKDPKNPKYGRDLAALRTPNGKPRFERRGKKIYQRSMVEPNLVWEVTQTVDTINPKSEHYNPKSALAKTVRFEGNKMVWGNVPANKQCDDSGCAHSNKKMTCQVCHSSWNPSCFGCHLPQKANIKMPQLHNDGDVTRNYVHYNFQTLRQAVFMLARDGVATGNRINPSRSSCAIHVGSYNERRESIYVQQQTISAEGFSGIAFSTNVPHTFSGKGTTKMCTDCHVSVNNDNNAITAQLLMHGTGYLNFMGRYCWVAAGDHGLYAPIVTERDEPQAVIGSFLHKHAYPDHFKKHIEEHNGYLEDAHEHPGKDISDNIFFRKKVEILDVQNRGEYLYAACGKHGLRVFDISFIDHKGFSERIFTAPVSPIGQRFYVRTKYATSVAVPCTMAPDPTRRHYKENKEGRVHAMYAYLYVTDKHEGVILVPAGTLLDGNPLNNFLYRDVTFNPHGLLDGARAMTFVGTHGYVCCDAGLVVIDFDNPKKPKVKSVIDKTLLKHPKAVACQFRYCYVVDDEGIKVFDITHPTHPKAVSELPLEGAHSIYLARTYAYVAAGKKGLVILDIEKADRPRVDQVYTAHGCINDLHDVQLAITYNSQFAYLADGKNGMRIVQLTSPNTPGNNGFSPRPTPRLIATYKIPKGGHALAITRALDRDRAVDESGNQLSVFGRLGARPFNLEEQQRIYLRNGQLYQVSDDPKWPGYCRRVAPFRK